MHPETYDKEKRVAGVATLFGVPNVLTAWIRFRNPTLPGVVPECTWSSCSGVPTHAGGWNASTDLAPVCIPEPPARIQSRSELPVQSAPASPSLDFRVA